MAKIKSSIHKEISGRIGDLIFYQRNGKSFIRSMPSTYRDKKSEKQILHRKKFSTLVNLFHKFRTALRFEIKEKNTNPFSIFCKLNWKNVSVDLDSVTINYEELVLSNQLPIQLSGLEINHSENQVSFDWNADYLLDESFFVLCAVYCKGIQQVCVNAVPRDSANAIVPLPDNVGEIISYTYTFRKTL
jgi:hypothetical protein